jgi:hypothetical protein
MTIYHMHHIIPKHEGGTDDPSNLVKLTIEEHAKAHRLLYEKNGKWEDYFAWQGLAGLISHEDILLAVRDKLTTINKSEERRLYNREWTKKQWEEGRGVADQDKMKAGAIEKYGVDNIRKLKVECPHCGKLGQKVAFKRWHFDNCKALKF